MEIKELKKTDIEAIYRSRMQLDFPPEEIRPWDMFERSFSLNFYKGYGLYDSGKLLSYAFFTFSGSSGTILLDYFAVDSSLRGKGIGGKFLAQLSEMLVNKLVILEVENPAFAKNPLDFSLRTRRINFYKRCGACLSGITSKVFEADFAIMYISKTGEKNDSEIYSAVKEIYSAMFTEEILEKHINVYEKENI